MSGTFFGNLSLDRLATSFNLSGNRTPVHMDRRMAFLSILLWELQQTSLRLWDQLNSLASYSPKGTIRGTFDTAIRTKFRAEPNIPTEIKTKLLMIEAFGISRYVDTGLEAADSNDENVAADSHSEDVTQVSNASNDDSDAESTTAKPTRHYLLASSLILTPSNTAKRLQCFGDQTSDLIEGVVKEISKLEKIILGARDAVTVMGVNQTRLDELKKQAESLSEKLSGLGIPAIPLGPALGLNLEDTDTSEIVENDIGDWPLDYLEYWIKRKYEILLHLSSFTDISLKTLNAYDAAIRERVNDIARPEGAISNRAVAESFGAVLLFETSQMVSDQPKRRDNEYDRASSEICKEVRHARPNSLKKLTTLVRKEDLDLAIWEHAAALGKQLYPDKETAMKHNISRTALDRSLAGFREALRIN